VAFSSSAALERSSVMSSSSSSTATATASTPIAASRSGPAQGSFFEAPVSPLSPVAGASVAAGAADVQDMLRERERNKESKQMTSVEKEMLVQGIVPVFDPTRKQSTVTRLDFSGGSRVCIYVSVPVCVSQREEE
jgi:hypothetical protein